MLTDWKRLSIPLAKCFLCVSICAWFTTGVNLIQGVFMVTFTTVQGLLDSIGLARNGDPSTSHEAAKQVPASLEAQVLAAFRAFPDGATADMIVDRSWPTLEQRYAPIQAVDGAGFD
jgi:hypothetical protein